MNILVVTLDVKPNSGGIAEYTHQRATYLQFGGDSVLVVAPKTHPITGGLPAPGGGAFAAPTR